MAEKLEIIISATNATTGAFSALQNSLNGLSNAGKSASSFLSNAFSFALGGAIQTGLSGIASAVSGIADAMINGNAEMEQYQAAFETMLGGVEQANTLMQELKQTGATTPFEFKDLAKGSQTLLAFGVSAKDLIPTLRQLGDVSGGDVNKLNSLTLAFGQVASSGRLTGGDLLQFINVGFNPLNIIAQKTGKSMAELREEMSKGNVTFEMVKDAFASATGPGGQFNGMMEKQAQTMKGLTSTFNDMLSEAGRTIGKPFFDLAKQGLIGVMEWMGSPATQAAVQGLADWITNTLTPAFVQMTQWIAANVLPALQNLATTALPLVAQASQFVIDNWQIFSTIGAALGAVIIALNAPIIAIGAVVALLATAWANNWGGIQDKTNAVMNFIRPLIDSTMAAISSTITSILAYVQNWWAAHGASVMVIVNALMTAIQTIITTVLTFVQNLWTQHGATVMLIAQTMWSNMATVYQAAADLLGALIDALAALIEGDWDKLSAALQSIWDTAWNAIAQILRNAITILGTIAGQIVQRIKDAFNIDWGAIGRGIINSIIAGLREYEGRIYEWLEQMIDRILNAINNALGGARAAVGAAASGGAAQRTAVSRSALLGSGARGDAASMTRAVVSQSFVQNVYTSADYATAIPDFALLRARARS